MLADSILLVFRQSALFILGHATAVLEANREILAEKCSAQLYFCIQCGPKQIVEGVRYRAYLPIDYHRTEIPKLLFQCRSGSRF